MKNYIQDRVDDIKSCIDANKGVLDEGQIAQILNVVYSDGYSDAYEEK